MARTPEAAVKAACVDVLKAAGAYYHFTVTGGYGRSGAPDIFACIKGYFLAIECKAGSNKPTALQEAEMRKIDDADGITLVIREDTVSLLVKTINKILKEYP